MSRRSKKRRPRPCRAKAATMKETSTPSMRSARVLGPDFEPSAWLRSVEAAADELDAMVGADAPDGAVAVVSCNTVLRRGGDGTCDRCRGPIAGGRPMLAYSECGHIGVVIGLCGTCSAREGWSE